MKIGVDASCWSNQRGYGRYTRELLTALLNVDAGHQYVFLVDEASQTSDFPGGATPLVVPTSRAAVSAAAADGYRPVSDILRMTWATRGDFDLFFFPAVYSYFPVLPGPKCVVTFHDAIAERLPHLTLPSRRAQLFWQAKSRLALLQSDMVLTVSEYAKRTLLEYWKLDAQRVRAVLEAPSALFRRIDDATARDSVLGRFGVNPASPYLIYVGGISPHKNLEMLVEVFCELAGEPRFADIRLLLVGDFKTDVFYSSFPALSRFLEQQEQRDQVVFTGYVPDDDLVHLYNGALALVFPSFDEGFGLPAVEAMACGTPVVLSTAGALPEVAGDAGVYFDPHDRRALRAALQQVVGDPSLRTELSRRSLERAADFNWRRTATQVLELFEQVAAQ